MIKPPITTSKIPQLEIIIDSIIKAGDKILEIYESNFQVEKKADNSPITKADLESNKIIKESLLQTGISILSEEDADDKSRMDSDKVWIVDPLDGTQDFVNKTGEFTVMIGLVENYIPIMGLVYWPTERKLYFAENGFGAFCHNSQGWTKILVRNVEEVANSLALVSRHHLSDKEKKMLDHLKIKNIASIGSSLKVMEIATGRADVYLTGTNKMKQWDTAASHCIISEAGGRMTDIFGNDLVYNTDSVNHENGLLVTNGFVHEKIVSKISELK